MTVDGGPSSYNNEGAEGFQEGLRVLAGLSSHRLGEVRQGVQSLVLSYGEEVAARIIRENLKYLAWLWSSQAPLDNAFFVTRRDTKA